jgi:hypothetical protein
MDVHSSLLEKDHFGVKYLINIIFPGAGAIPAAKCRPGAIPALSRQERKEMGYEAREEELPFGTRDF